MWKVHTYNCAPSLHICEAAWGGVGTEVQCCDLDRLRVGLQNLPCARICHEALSAGHEIEFTFNLHPKVLARCRPLSKSITVLQCMLSPAPTKMSNSASGSCNSRGATVWRRKLRMLVFHHQHPQVCVAIPAGRTFHKTTFPQRSQNGVQLVAQ